jgi:hypothetical protein
METGDFGQAKEEIERRVSAGKKIIDSQTKKGDLVLLESPEEWTEEQFKRAFHGSKNERFWLQLMRDSLNLYFDLAQYAKSQGRLVGSLESGLHSPSSRLVRAALWRHQQPAEIAERIDFLSLNRRDATAQKRVQAQKPRRVITAFFHGISIENAFRPEKTIYFDPTLNNPKLKAGFLEQKNRAAAKYYKKKVERRRTAMQKAKTRPIARPKKAL